jgi:transposase
VLKSDQSWHHRWRLGARVEDAGLSDRQMQQCPYDYPRCRKALRRRGITPRMARRGVESSQRLGRHRFVVERSLAWLVGYRRVQVRYERRADVLAGFLWLACALICLKSQNSQR